MCPPTSHEVLGSEDIDLLSASEAFPDADQLFLESFLEGRPNEELSSVDVAANDEDDILAVIYNTINFEELNTKELSRSNNDGDLGSRINTVDMPTELPEIKQEAEEDESLTKKKLVCKVCGDAASGFHYRVASCEACKAFFKRTVQGEIEYYCQTDGDCKISIRGRKACQACRFQKCIKAGMLKEGVRQDRSRGGRQKYYRKRYIPSAPINTDFNAIFDALKVTDTDEHPEMAVCPFSGRFLKVGEISNGARFTANNIWTIIADLYNKRIETVVIPLKTIPGFNKFEVNDQMSLFRGGWSEILTFSLVYNTIGKTSLKFAPNFQVEELVAHLCGMETFYNKCMTIVTKIAQIGGMHHEEFLLLKALLLANGDVTLDDSSKLMELRDTLLSALNSKATNLRGASQGILHVQKLLMLLPAIREVDLIMKDLWKMHIGDIHIRNGLFLDMLK